MTIPADDSTSAALLSVQDLMDRWQGTTQPASRTTLTRWRRLGVGPGYIRAGKGGKVFYHLDSILQHEALNHVYNLSK